MTLREALAQRIPRVRKAPWASGYLRLPLLAHKTYGPWAELYDDVVQRDVLLVRPGSQRVLVMTALDEEEYEVYTGPVSPFEQDPANFAKIYEEG